MAVATERFKLSIEAVDVLLPINAAIPCGLVVNELISNALKHAFPDGREGEITIDLAARTRTIGVAHGQRRRCRHSEKTSISRRPTTLGLQLVTLLADQLGGDAGDPAREPTRFALRFPLQQG